MQEENLDALLDAIIDNDSKKFFYHLEKCFENETLRRISSSYFCTPLSVCLEYDRSHFAKAILEKDKILKESADKYISMYVSQNLYENNSIAISKKTIKEIVFSFGVVLSEEVVIAAIETENIDFIEFLLYDIGYNTIHIFDIINQNDIPVSKSIKELIESYEDIVKEPQT